MVLMEKELLVLEADLRKKKNLKFAVGSEVNMRGGVDGGNKTA